MTEAVHAALAEYVRNHRAEFGRLMCATQKALAHGAIDALAQVATSALERELDSLVAELPI